MSVSSPSSKLNFHLNYLLFLNEISAEPSLPEILRQEARTFKETLRMEETVSPLRLGFIGEWSTGKTTLINSFFKTGFLETGIMEVTNVPCFIRYGDSMKIVRRKEAQKESYDVGTCDGASLKENLSVLKKRLSEIMEGREHETDRLDIKIPKPVLKKIELVDTPGVNTILSDHEKSTQKILNQLHAAVFVLTPESQFKQSTKNFLEKNKRFFANHSFFVLNQAASMDSDKRQKLKTHIQKKLESSLDQSVSISVIPGLPATSKKARKKLLTFWDKILTELKESWSQRQFERLFLYQGEQIEELSHLGRTVLGEVQQKVGDLEEDGSSNLVNKRKKLKRIKNVIHEGEEEFEYQFNKIIEELLEKFFQRTIEKVDEVSDLQQLGRLIHKGTGLKYGSYFDYLNEFVIFFWEDYFNRKLSKEILSDDYVSEILQRVEESVSAESYYLERVLRRLRNEYYLNASTISVEGSDISLSTWTQRENDLRKNLKTRFNRIFQGWKLEIKELIKSEWADPIIKIVSDSVDEYINERESKIENEISSLKTSLEARETLLQDHLSELEHLNQTLVTLSNETSQDSDGEEWMLLQLIRFFQGLISEVESLDPNILKKTKKGIQAIDQSDQIDPRYLERFLKNSTEYVSKNNLIERMSIIKHSIESDEKLIEILLLIHEVIGSTGNSDSFSDDLVKNLRASIDWGLLDSIQYWLKRSYIDVRQRIPTIS